MNDPLDRAGKRLDRMCVEARCGVGSIRSNDSMPTLSAIPGFVGVLTAQFIFVALFAQPFNLGDKIKRVHLDRVELGKAEGERPRNYEDLVALTIIRVAPGYFDRKPHHD